MNKKRTLLIDGDLVAYRFGSASEKAIDWGDGFWTLSANAEEASEQAIGFIEGLKKTLQAEAVVVALTDSQNFRKQIDPDYKANREGQRKPMVLKPVRQALEATFSTFIRPGLEADDVLGILSTSTRIIPGETVVVSWDKDLRSVPGLFYNPTLDDPEIVSISEEEADRWFLTQTLTGDATDNYPGCPGYGPKKAERLLSEVSEWDLDAAWELVEGAFKKAGLGREVALRQARLARILRVDDYDFKQKTPILWEPPKPRADKEM